MSKIVFGIDMDGCLVDLCQYWLDLYNQETGENVKEEEITNWDMTRFCKYPDVLNNILSRKDFFLNPPPYKDSVEYFKKILKDKDLDIFVVTQSPRESITALYDKRMWLKKYFEDFDIDRVISAHRKYLIDADVLVDDNSKHLKEFKEWREGRITVAIDHLYNNDANVDYRVSNWQELYENILPQIKKEKL